MQPPIDIPLPRTESGLVAESINDSFSTRSTFRSRRGSATPRPSISQRPSHQWSLFSQLMENEGQLPSSSPTRRISRAESDGDLTSSPALSTRIRPSPNFHTHYSEEPTTYDTSSSVHHPIISENPNEYESNSFSSSLEVLPTSTQSYLPFRLPTFTIIHRNILKCAIAYFVASLFTFSPHLSRLISDLSPFWPNDPTTPSPTGHMVATM